MTKVLIGIKIWAHNIDYIPALEALHQQGYCDFIELYVPNKYGMDDINPWQAIKLPIRCHAPHSYGGFNPAKPEHINEKKGILSRVDHYLEKLKSPSIVFHPGLDGKIEESIAQYSEYAKDFPRIFSKAFIENKPSVGMKNERCLGANKDELKLLIDAIGFGFCLDFGHAACSAVFLGIKWQQVVESLMTLRPTLFHLSDGDIYSPMDKHLHLGEGNFPLKEMAAYLPNEAIITLETPHDSQIDLDDFKKDADMMRKLVA